MITSEKKLEKYLKDLCKSLGFFEMKLTSSSHDGIPDRLIITPKGICLLELKSFNEKPQKLQKAIIKQINNIYPCAFCIDNDKDLYELLIRFKE